MKLLRVVVTFDAKNNIDVARQTSYISESDLEKGKVDVNLRGKNVTSITVQLVDKEKEEENLKSIELA